MATKIAQDITQISPFKMQGRFFGLAIADSDKPKFLRLITADGEYYIKLSKFLRLNLPSNLILGDWIEVSGERKFQPKKGEFKFKAEQLTLVERNSPQTELVEKAIAPQCQSNILVCQKSDCLKRGAGNICQALAKGLGDRGLATAVKIKGTGCMKDCKAGPNIVMPDKTRYSKIHPAAIPILLEKHFPAEKTSEFMVKSENQLDENDYLRLKL